MKFLERVRSLPTLGIGVSTEYGAGDMPGGLDLPALATHHPEWASFLELGVEVSKGLDTHGEAWLRTGKPTTHHFLDVNLDDPADFDPAWMEALRALLARSRPAWLCGDAGLWHFGRRERGHMLLLPPLLTDDAARAYGAGIAHLREATGLEVLPENPPGAVYVGNRHLLDTFARMCEAGDTGMLLDAAHLAIYQRLHGHDALTGLDRRGMRTESARRRAGDVRGGRAARSRERLRPAAAGGRRGRGPRAGSRHDERHA
jgi:hypothetical protein